MIRIVLLGSGNVAQHLYAAFSVAKGIRIVQCYNRKGISLHPDQKKDRITSHLHTLLDADVYIMAVSDDAIEEVSRNLPFKDKLVVHVSGSVPIDTLSDANRKGVFYPLQTFSKNKSMNYAEIPFCIEAQRDMDMQLLKKLAASVSEKVYEITSVQRGILHVAAVFVNNFTNYLFTTGKEICDAHQIPFEILHPLIQETSKKITEMFPEEAQTGPAVRGDMKTINRHVSILEKDSQKQIYHLLTEAIQAHYGKKL